MANYYTQFSEEIKNITVEEEAWIKEELTPPLERASSEVFLRQWHKDHPLDDPDEHEYWPAFSRAYNGNDLTLFSEDHCSIDNVGIFVQRFLTKWRPKDVFTLTWANTCSSPRVGAFSGGWLVVSKDEVIYGNAYSEAEQVAQALKNESEVATDVRAGKKGF